MGGALGHMEIVSSLSHMLADALPAWACRIRLRPHLGVLHRPVPRLSTESAKDMENAVCIHAR